MNLLLSWLSSKVLIPGTRSERTKGVWKRNKNLAKLKHHNIEKRRELGVNSNGIIHLKNFKIKLEKINKYNTFLIFYLKMFSKKLFKNKNKNTLTFKLLFFVLIFIPLVEFKILKKIYSSFSKKISTYFYQTRTYQLKPSRSNYFFVLILIPSHAV